MDGSVKSVLIVDDQVNWRGLLHELLENEFDVTVAENYAEALEIISRRADPFHVVVTDMRLEDKQPGNEDGVKLIEYLHTKGNETKTVLLTGYPTIATARKILKQLEAHDYLEKRPSDGSDFDPANFQKTVREAAAAAEADRNKLVFVLMPFDEKYKDFYENEIKTTIAAKNLICRRVDDFFLSSHIMADIVRCIKEAKFILADFSGRNPNVFFEVGISHAMGKNVLLLTQELEDVPPKLQTVRCLVYESSLEGAQKLIPILERAVDDIRQTNYAGFFEQQNYPCLPRTCLALVPGTTNGGQTYNQLIARALTAANCQGQRADQIFKTGSVLDAIWAHINTAELIIADLSGRDADVFYLAGLAYGLNKKIIYLASEEGDVPFDLKSGSYLIYALKPYNAGITAQHRLTELIKDLVN